MKTLACSTLLSPLSSLLLRAMVCNRWNTNYGAHECGYAHTRPEHSFWPGTCCNKRGVCCYCLFFDSKQRASVRISSSSPSLSRMSFNKLPTDQQKGSKHTQHSLRPPRRTAQVLRQQNILRLVSFLTWCTLGLSRSRHLSPNTERRSRRKHRPRKFTWLRLSCVRVHTVPARITDTSTVD